MTCCLFVDQEAKTMLRPCRLLLWEVALRLSYHVVTGEDITTLLKSFVFHWTQAVMI